MKKKNIVVIGLGYVGCSISVLLAQKHNVAAVDLNEDKVSKINNKKSPVEDIEISNFLDTKKLYLKAFLNINEASLYHGGKVDFYIIATPTNFDTSKSFFDTSSIEKVLTAIHGLNHGTNVVIKSTIPIGFTQRMKSLYNSLNIVFSPEFLREGQALYDNLYPSRIIAGGNESVAKTFIELLSSCAMKKKIPTLIVGEAEAEAIKLFANTFLAMRVSFFNELDTFAMSSKLSSKEIIDGVCMDERIGDYYNNPSFGYGGYCLPKDSMQLQSHFQKIPQDLISAVIDSNEIRKNFLVESILLKGPKIVGVFRLIMKTGSDNFRESAIIDLINKLKEKGIKILIYEPQITGNSYKGNQIIKDLDQFKIKSDLIVSNRYDAELSNVKDILFTRDIYGNN
ncbi:nucleotide sugar dehydrogenase [Gammaproteobacteria bacterium]|nr:nucleotide sugar dehydrogenase [Gammaproteobacteria bacterium]